MERDYEGEAAAIVKKLVVGWEGGGDLVLVRRDELEGEVASLLRKIEIAKEDR